MGIKADFYQAEKIIDGLRPADKERLRAVCESIQAAETRLLSKAAASMDRCIAACQGLCCRNIQLEAVIGVWDLVYILTVAGAYRDQMAACLENEIPFYAADCIFLADGGGPCILPDNARAEVCLTTFCSRTESIDRDIRRVKRRFYRLGWFIATRRPLILVDRLRRRRTPRVCNDADAQALGGRRTGC
ncbi:MAG TPA: hypothetical protein VLT88_14280, partial [Desulfosarcina sp.]|nr:hypothetical protein [Desulfosarcina sp.]